MTIKDKMVQELLNEFTQHFPKIDFSEVTSGYGQVENLLIPHIEEFTEEQWKVILDCTYDNLFQIGLPHYSWRAERENIIFELINRYNLRPCSTWHETWCDCQKYSVRMPCGVILEMVVENPTSWSNGCNRTHYSLKIAEKFIPVPTHRAVILAVSTDTRAYIKGQFAGTLDECENWVAENVKGNFFKIMPIR